MVNAQLTPRLGPLFPEWFDLQPSAPIRQGDVLEAVAPDVDTWRRTLVVLTADCDLAHRKHGGALTCIPLLTSEDYLLAFRAPKLHEGLISRLVRKVLKVYERGAGDDAANISEERIRAWLQEETSIELLSSTLGLSGRSAEQFVSAAGCAQALLEASPASIEQAVASIAVAKVELGDLGAVERARQTVARDFASHLQDLPGDALFLNEVSTQHSGGYVAYLRRVVELRDTGVALTTSRLPSDAQYVRVSRLRSPYIYAMTQQFASVFSAIGLPDEYERAREVNAERVCMSEEVE